MERSESVGFPELLFARFFDFGTILDTKEESSESSPAQKGW
jgi:hypothetical protein